MGGGTSKQKLPPRREREEVEHQINVQILFCALHKLSYAFEINESLKRNLVKRILDPGHHCFEEKYCAVEGWVLKHNDSELTPQEIFHLIKYVEPYQSNAKRDSEDDMLNAAESDILIQASEDSESSEINICPPLMCPYRSDVAAWTAEVRSQEIKRDVDMRDEAFPFSSFEMTGHDEGCFVRKRSNTDRTEHSEISLQGEV